MKKSEKTASKKRPKMHFFFGPKILSIFPGKAFIFYWKFEGQKHEKNKSDTHKKREKNDKKINKKNYKKSEKK